MTKIWTYVKYIGLAVLGLFFVIVLSRKPAWLRVKEEELEKDKKKVKIKEKDVEEAKKEVDKETKELENKIEEYKELVEENNKKIEEAKDVEKTEEEITDPYDAIHSIADDLANHSSG